MPAEKLPQLVPCSTFSTCSTFLTASQQQTCRCIIKILLQFFIHKKLKTRVLIFKKTNFSRFNFCAALIVLVDGVFNFSSCLKFLLILLIEVLILGLVVNNVLLLWREDELSIVCLEQFCSEFLG